MESPFSVNNLSLPVSQEVYSGHHMGQDIMNSTICFSDSDATLATPKERLYPDFEVGPFEGVEKRLIVQFDPRVLQSSALLEKGSLRSLSQAHWQKLLDQAACQILSFISLESDQGACTAYLLSESSLFVYDTRIVLKTCGTTTPLLVLPVLLDFVSGSFVFEVEKDPSTASLAKNEKKSLEKSKESHFDVVSLASQITSATESRSVDDQLSTHCDHGDSDFSGDETNVTSGTLSVCATDEETSSINDGLPDATMVVSKSMPCFPFCTSSLTEEQINVNKNGSSSEKCPFLESNSDGENVLERMELLNVKRDVFQTSVSWMLFSHLSYCFPEKQKYPHRSNEEEIHYLDLFCLPPNNDIESRQADILISSLQTSDLKEFFFYSYRNSPNKVIQTPFIISEMMMLKIEGSCVQTFAGNGSGYSPENPTCKNSYVHKVVKDSHSSTEKWQSSQSLSSEFSAEMNAETLSRDPFSELDQFWFDPCGYSCNALIQSDKGCCHFATAHISPEPESSYASLEATFPFNHNEIKKASYSNVSHSIKNAMHQESLQFEQGPVEGQQGLSFVDAMKCFNPQVVHIVEVQIDSTDQKMFGGPSVIEVPKKRYELVDTKEERNSWLRIRHSEYLLTEF